MTEEEIAILLKNEPDRAIAYIKNTYGKLIRFVIGNIIDNLEEIEECEEDAYVAIWKNAGKYEQGNIKAYVAKIARSQALERYRYLNAEKRNRNMTVYLDELDEALSSENVFDKKEDVKELYTAINSFLAKIKATSRELFILRYWYGASTEAISKSTGFSKSKIESDIYRTRKKLRKYLKERCDYE